MTLIVLGMSNDHDDVNDFSLGNRLYFDLSL